MKAFLYLLNKREAKQNGFIKNVEIHWGYAFESSRMLEVSMSTEEFKRCEEPPDMDRDRMETRVYVLQ